jgi:hypothetical protein
MCAKMAIQSLLEDALKDLLWIIQSHTRELKQISEPKKLQKSIFIPIDPMRRASHGTWKIQKNQEKTL